MATINYFFFYSYVGLVVLAGLWGAFIYPVLDFSFLLQMNIESLPEYSRVNLLSQYRFLRALELGYGLYSLYFLKDIFSKPKYNQLFLSIMGLGIMARLFSWVQDGTPSDLFIFFLIYEALGWVAIFIYSLKMRIYHAN